jgi:TP901-1 family phage major tail protein
MGQVAGKNVLVAVKISNSWVEVGGQTNMKREMSANEIDASTKTNNGWGTTETGLKKWSMDVEFITETLDSGLQAVLNAFKNSAAIEAAVKVNGSEVFSGTARVSKYSDEADKEDMLKGSFTLASTGIPTFTSF